MTFSIIAYESHRQYAVAATASHYAAVGGYVPWAGPEGAVAAQAHLDATIGPAIMDRIGSGHPPAEAIERVLAGAGPAALRQAGAVCSAGSAAHTGVRCMPHAGHSSGRDGSLVVVALGNLLASPDVWQILLDAFMAETDMPLPERSVTALVAANDAGGDRRGELAAAVAVHEPGRGSWQVRIDASETAVSDLSEVLEVQRAWHLTEEATDLLAEAGEGPSASEAAQAVALLSEAARRSRGNREILAYLSAAHAAAGDMDAARRAAGAAGRPFTAELLDLVDASGWFPIHPALRRRRQPAGR